MHEGYQVTEQWYRWEPITTPESNYYLQSLRTTKTGLKIILTGVRNKKLKIHILFASSIAAYKITDDTFTLKFFDDLAQHHKESFFQDHTFFKISNSSYVKQLCQDSYGIGASRNLVHFAIVAIDALIEVVAPIKPKIKVLNDERAIN